MISESQPVTAMVFSSAQHAHLVRSVLLSQGIACRVTGDQLTDVLSIYGSAVARVELLVDASQLERAQSVLSEMNLNPAGATHDRWGIPIHPDWQCSLCDEVNGTNFDECWSCGHQRSDDDQAVVEQPEDQKFDSGWMPDASRELDPSPYRVPGAIAEPVARVKPDSDIAERAMRAAVMGMVFPIPIAFVAAYLSLKSWHEDGPEWRNVLAAMISVPLSIASGAVMMMGLGNLVTAANVF